MPVTTSRALCALALSFVLVVAPACGGSAKHAADTTADTAADATPDTTADATPDTTADATPDTSGACYLLKDGTCVQETFKNPTVLTPDDNGVYQLELKPAEFLVDGKRQCGRTYNGLYPAPTLDIAAEQNGQPRHVRVDLRNRFTHSDVRSLSGDDCSCSDSMGMSCVPDHDHMDAMGDCVCTTSKGDECHMFDFNVTNLHAHGSHVRPDYATGGGCTEHDGLACRACSGDRDATPRECFFADDVIGRVHPGEGVQHRWDLDEDGTHHEGLDWYHPHIHGSTAIQVASGATGALIIRGPVDELPGIAHARERIMLIMTPPVGMTPLPDGQACDEDHITFDDFSVLGATDQKQTNLINGIRRPRMVMAPGQIERWRFLHGAFLDEMFIAVFRGKDSDCKNLDFDAGPVALTQIGRDGLTLPKPPSGADWPFAPPYVFLSPGYRVDALLDGGPFHDGDTLCMMSARFLQEDTSGTTTGDPVESPIPDSPDAILQAIGNGDLIGIVDVAASAGPATETHMPDLADLATHAPSMMLEGGTLDALARCDEVQKITDPTQIDEAAVLWALFFTGEGDDPCGCHDHNINCKNFETTDRVRYPYDRVFELGKVEHWRLTSGFDGHPFHIHINPFLVCPLPPAGSPDRNTKGRLFEPPFAHWRDTYLVNLDRVVDFLTEYRKFSGDYVFHCHKLTHEDHGMMELVHICDPATESCDTLCEGHPCGWRDCYPGDTNCQRELATADCILDPTTCPDALLRCTTCGQDQSCPPDAYCGDQVADDGAHRCIPGCRGDDDCAPTARCDAGDCEPAPPCAPPCGPGKSCVHGACE